jgi:hypothetical protein
LLKYEHKAHKQEVVLMSLPVREIKIPQRPKFLPTMTISKMSILLSR